MKLIADSGSTKTSWYLVTDSKNIQTGCITAGINPFFQQSSEIVKTLEAEFVLSRKHLNSIYFYGAGAANASKKEELKKALYDYFQVENIVVESDLLAAAHSLCGTDEGIVAIMGTGSNSCHYNGKTIEHNVSPLGYILGDEGSGAVLGRQLLSDILKNQFPQHLIKLFFDTYEVTAAEILENVYRQPFPNRYMASFTKFLSSNMEEPAVKDLLMNSFSSFFQRNISQYSKAQDLPVHFTGSIAWHFRDALMKAAQKNGFTIGNITSNPLQGLIAYHKKDL